MSEEKREGWGGCATVSSMAAIVSLPLYILSTGPVVWLIEFYDLPDETIAVLYFPIVVVCWASPQVERAMNWYVQLWVG